MTGPAPYLLAVAAVGALLAAIAGIRKVGTHWRWSAEVQRKCVHVMVGLFAMALPFLLPGKWPVVVLVLLALAAMLVLRFSSGFLGGAGAAIHSVERRSFGDIWLAVAVGFLFLRSEGHYILFGLPLAIITLSDAAAALTGSTYGRLRFATEGGEKSWEGVIAFTMVGWITAMAMLLLFSDAPRGNVIVLGLVIAAFGAMVEAISWRGLDNLFVPLAIHFFLRGYLDAAPMELSLVAVTFFALAATAAGVSQWLGLTRSTARAFAVALFIFLGVGGVGGTVFPALAIGAYLLTRGVLPGGRLHPDLDFLGTLCSAAAIWLFIGEMTGPSSIHFYNVAMAGIALGYGLLALAGRQRLWALVLLPSCWAGVRALALTQWHPAGLPDWYGTLGIASLFLVACIALAMPHLFRRWRAPRLALLASALPLAAYFHQVGAL
ncbi:MAG: hypothetical protein KGL44_09015 [Sphingomonadales bacterium]|nr:hypothetical protein [Sphingomonadales bacterium]